MSRELGKKGRTQKTENVKSLGERLRKQKNA